MDRTMLSQWIAIAGQLCKLDSARETAAKYKGLCNLVEVMQKELSPVLDACLEEALNEFRNVRFAKVKWGIWGLLRYNKDQSQLEKLMQTHDGSDDDIEALYKSVRLYVSLLNEIAEVETLAAIMDKAPDLPHNKAMLQNGGTIHPKQEIAPEGKLKRFMERVPYEHHKKAEDLLQRVIDTGYCNENYYWITNRWDDKSHILALAYFVYKASDYLNIKTFTYYAKDGTKEEKKATAWKPFELLFDYDGKEQGKDKLKTAQTNYLTKAGLIEFEPPEQIAKKISELFK